MERDLTMAGGSALVSGEAGICPGGCWLWAPSHTSVLGICCTHFTQQKRRAAESCLKSTGSEGIGGKEGKFFFIAVCTNNSQIKGFGWEREAQGWNVWPPCGLHREQLNKMLHFQKALLSFPLLSGRWWRREKTTSLQLINHWETVITGAVFGIIIQGLPDRNKPKNYHSSFL